MSLTTDGDWAAFARLNTNDQTLAMQPAILRGQRVLLWSILDNYQGPADLEHARPWTYLTEDDALSLCRVLSAWVKRSFRPPAGEEAALMAEYIADCARRDADEKEGGDH